ncbi:hypothetical protein VTN77DRAFT_473 [Rasamsonia byssochlamydoides]|uniref:uncharacterized protein n=1 Tax=Rasamsonia byssochlamydoides TaxID=89139 RepID=UPI00374269FB
MAMADLDETEQTSHTDSTPHLAEQPRRHLSTDDLREATELHEITTHYSLSSASVSSGEYRVTPRRSVASASERSSVRRDKQSFQAIRRFWSRNVALTVPQKGNRDYFALERTFLAYIRTSVVFSMQGVLIAQLFRLQNSHSTRFDFYTVGIPLSVAFHGCAILISAMGAFRFWRQQHAIARGKVYAGGWEMNCIGMLAMLATLTLFSLAIAIIIEIDADPLSLPEWTYSFLPSNAAGGYGRWLARW